MPTLQSGQTLASRYALIRRLGKGAMGEAWLARDQELGIELVVKAVPPEAPADRLALLRHECLKARRLSHPNIVRVFDFHQDPQASFLTMEFIEGGDIGQLRGASVGEVLDRLAPLARGLEYAHRQGVIHRDLKTSNVLLDADGHPHLTDFGIAAVLEPQGDDLRLSGGGSRGHASPQQLAGAPPTPADDVYGLGALAFELFTGAPPGPGRSKSGERQHLTELAVHPLPQRLVALVDSMLSDEPDKRPADMSLVATEIEALATFETADGTEPPRIERSKLRLSPPPRIPAVRSAEPVPTAPAALAPSRSNAARRWITTIGALALAAAVFAVFVLLPRWVDERDAMRETEASAASVSVSTDGMAPGGEADSESPDPPAALSPSTDSEPDPVTRATTQAAQPEVGSATARTAGARTASAATGLPATRPSAPAGADSSTSAEFNRAMTKGLAALEADEVEAAKQAFETALSLVPGSVEAADGLLRAEQALRLQEITDRRERARSFEQQERWSNAVSEYRAVLALDPSLQFAIQGLARAEVRSGLYARLQFHLDHPERLAEDAVLAEAREAVAEGRLVTPIMPVLERQLELLEQEIATAMTPISVLLLSDNRTEVVVYRVGRLGRFDRKLLELRPGTYTVVGSRSGYRDVRQQLEVVAGAGEVTMTVRCEEAI